MSDSIDDFFADVGQQSVVQDPFRFKARLRIGAEAFTVLSKAENLKDFVNLFSGSVAAAGLPVPLGMVALAHWVPLDFPSG